VRGIRISKRLLTSAVVGAFLVLGTVLIVSLIGGNDKPDITTEIPPDDEQLPDDNMDTQPDDSTPTDDSQDTSDDGEDDKTSDDDTSDGDQDDDPDETHQGKGEQNGNCHRHHEKHIGLVSSSAEHNALEHETNDAVDAHFGSDDAADDSEDEDSEEGEGGNGQGACNRGDDKGEESGQQME
jgi:hypothetical protein